jgi:hypothetical protein
MNLPRNVSPKAERQIATMDVIDTHAYTRRICGICGSYTDKGRVAIELYRTHGVHRTPVSYICPDCLKKPAELAAAINAFGDLDIDVRQLPTWEEWYRFRAAVADDYRRYASDPDTALSAAADIITLRQVP